MRREEAGVNLVWGLEQDGSPQGWKPRLPLERLDGSRLGDPRGD